MANWKGPKLPWGDDVDDDHYEDALDYLSLLWTPERAEPVVDRLRDASLVKEAPSDLLRAAGLPPLPPDNLGVVQEMRKALIDAEITPLLVVNLPHGIIIADGYHRTSMAYHLAPFHKVPLKIEDATAEERGDDPDTEGA